jgi:predicted alpha/beta hydrolase family esterase
LISAPSPTVLIVPGLRDHVPEHWQTLLEARLPMVACVPRRADDKLACVRWVEAIELSLARIEGPVIFVAHSGGVIMVVHWARKHRRPIHGALLATPADLESALPAGYPTTEQLAQNGWLPIPRQPLPFPSIVAASTDDPLARYDRVVEFAAAWGSRLVNLGDVGHLNPAAGYGPWPRAEELILELR